MPPKQQINEDADDIPFAAQINDDDDDDEEENDDKTPTNRTWLNDMITPDGKCLLCAYKLPSTTDVLIRGQYKGRKKYNLQNFSMGHWKKQHQHLPSFEAVLADEATKKKYEQNKKEHKAPTSNQLLKTRNAVFICFSTHGLPDSLVESIEFREMMAENIKLGYFPIQSRITFAKDRGEFAGSIKRQQFEMCRDRYVSLQLDIVTRCGNRFVGVVVQTHNPQNVEGTDGRRVKDLSKNQGPLLRYDLPAPKFGRTFLLDLRCDSQTPFTKGDAAQRQLVCEEEDDFFCSISWRSPPWNASCGQRRTRK